MKQKPIRPFHLAFPIKNIKETKMWYTNILGCSIGRESEKWIDFNFFGHQISAHLSEESDLITHNKVDGQKVPSRHFGIILTTSEWNTLAKRLSDLEVEFIIKPYTRFKGEKGEQSTLFIKDPSENFLEFKSFKDDDMIFAR
tara:strand:- start:49 stop:474 length:426 start_codon:yes stop_codon:yes gene_type:complete